VAHDLSISAGDHHAVRGSGLEIAYGMIRFLLAVDVGDDVRCNWCGDK
jgi:hypothetical protein